MKRKMTSTKNIADIINSKMVTVSLALVQEQVQKELRTVENIEIEKFTESIIALSNTIFADMIDWRYEHKKESSLDDLMLIGYVNNIIATYYYEVHLRVNDNASINDVQKKLNKTIFDRASA